MKRYILLLAAFLPFIYHIAFPISYKMLYCFELSSFNLKIKNIVIILALFKNLFYEFNLNYFHFDFLLYLLIIREII